MTDVTANPLQILSKIADGLAAERISPDNTELLANSGIFEGTPPLPMLGKIEHLNCKGCRGGKFPHTFAAAYLTDPSVHTVWGWRCTHCGNMHLAVYDSRSTEPKSL